MMKAIAVMALCGVVCGCETSPPQSGKLNGDYLFLEWKTENAGRIVKRPARKPGTVLAPAAIGRCLDFPTYWFEERFGILRGAFDFNEETPFVATLGKSHLGHRGYSMPVQNRVLK